MSDSKKLTLIRRGEGYEVVRADNTLTHLVGDVITERQVNDLKGKNINFVVIKDREKEHA